MNGVILFIWNSKGLQIANTPQKRSYRQTVKQDRLEIPYKDRHTHTQALDLWCGNNWISVWKKDTYANLMPYAKISSWGIGEPMNVKVKTMKLLENLEDYLHVLGITFFFN